MVLLSTSIVIASTALQHHESSKVQACPCFINYSLQRFGHEPACTPASLTFVKESIYALYKRVLGVAGVGGLRSRPSYLGSGEVQLAQQSQAPRETASMNGGGSFTGKRRPGSVGRGDSPPRSGGLPSRDSGGLAPQSAFFQRAQELGKDSSPVCQHALFCCVGQVAPLGTNL